MPDLPSGTVTLLFTDIEGSTQLLRLLGDAYANVLADHHRLLRDAFAAHQGYEVDTQGDAFFVAFARASDAVAAATAAQRALAAYPWSAGVTVGVRMGLHTGQPLLTDGRYIGLDVHRAARIAAAAHGGQVLLSQATADLVRDNLRDAIGLRGLGEHALKDFDRLEHLFQLVIEGIPNQFPELRTSQAPTGDVATTGVSWAAKLVGRAREMELLQTKLTHALAGHGGLVLLAGEPGIGKTRLVEALADEASQRGVQVLWGRCWETEGAPPFWPWVEILRGVVRSREPLVLRAELGAGASLVAELVLEVREQLPDLPPTPLMEPGEARFRLFDSVTAVLQNVSRSQPLLLILDDLHWADKPSLLLLQFMLQHLGGSRVLSVGTYRDTDLDRHHPLAEVLPSLRRERAFESIALKGLSVDGVDDLVSSFLNQPDSERGRTLAQALWRRTEGNPLFVREELRYLIENDRLLASGETWDAASIVDLGLPEGVRDVISRRLSRLSETTNGLLTVAAVIGREFDAAALERSSGLDEAGMDAALDEAQAARVLEELPRMLGRYRFHHALFREALYAELPGRRRMRLHRQVAESLEDLYRANREPHLAELAHHFLQAAPGGDVEKAVEYARRAGQRAKALLAYEEAAGHYDLALKALELKESTDEAQRCELLLALGEAWWAVGDIPKAREAFQRAAEAAQSLGIPEPLVRAALGYGGSWLEGGPVLVTLLERALNALAGQDSALRARVLARLSLELSRAPGAWERSAALSGQAAEMARRVGDPTVLAYALSTRNTARLGPEYVEERLSAAAAIAKLAEGTGDVEMALQGHQFLFIGLLERGDIATADLELEVCARLAEEFRQPLYLENNLTHRAARALIEGRLEDAEHLGEQAQAIGKDLAYSAAPDYVPHLFVLRREQGRLGELDAVAMGFFEQHPDLAWVRSMTAVLSSELDREAEARRELEYLAANDFAGMTRDSFWLASLALLSEVCAALGDTRSAITLYDLQLPYAGRNVVVGWAAACLGSAARYLGLLGTTLGRWEAATKHFEAALAMNLRMGARLWVAHSQHDYAAMLLARGATDDQEKAQQLLDQALATALELGMVRLAEQISNLAPRPTSARWVRLSPPSSALRPSVPDRLTEREVEVLRLVASGRSNRQIAEALVVTVNTVERHLVNAYGKIGARGRADATAYAFSHGLIEFRRS